MGIYLSPMVCTVNRQIDLKKQNKENPKTMHLSLLGSINHFLTNFIQHVHFKDQNLKFYSCYSALAISLRTITDSWKSLPFSIEWRDSWILHQTAKLCGAYYTYLLNLLKWNGRKQLLLPRMFYEDRFRFVKNVGAVPTDWSWQITCSLIR